MKKTFGLISKNAKFIFIIISLYSLIDGPCLSQAGCLTPENVLNGKWMVPIINSFDRFLFSLFLSLPVVIGISIFDYFVKPKTRTSIFAIATILVFVISLYLTFITKGMGALGIAGGVIFSVTVMFLTTVYNWYHAKKD